MSRVLLIEIGKIWQHMEYAWEEPHCGGVLFVCFCVQKFAGTNKLQQSGNRSMSYLVGKAERCGFILPSAAVGALAVFNGRGCITP